MYEDVISLQSMEILPYSPANMTLFLEKKTNIGFFYLKDPFCFRFFHSSTDRELLFIVLKLYFSKTILVEKIF